MDQKKPLKGTLSTYKGAKKTLGANLGIIIGNLTQNLILKNILSGTLCRRDKGRTEVGSLDEKGGEPTKEDRKQKSEQFAKMVTSKKATEEPSTVVE